jgi:hypothetical protein
MKDKISIEELSDERYDVIDEVVDYIDIIDFIKSVEKIQHTLSASKIEAEEMYQYLLTLMLHQC